jgi:glycosyltransferase involved in cell wall biosynthesis
MTIRVAYDITLLGQHLSRAESMCGIARVYEEVLFELSHRDDVDLTAVSVCGDEDPLQTSVHSQLYFEARAGRVRGRYVPAYRSRLGLTGLYQSVFSACRGEELAGGARGLGSALRRGGRSALYRLGYTLRLDSLRRSFDARAYDVFHSSYLRFPPRSLTGGVPRVITIYDLIPVLAPEYVTPVMTSLFEQILESIDVERDWVTCISQHTKDEFCAYTGMSPERAFVAPLAASPEFRPVADAAAVAETRRRYGLPEGQYFLSLAAPQPRKNLAHLIRCFFRLLDEGNLPDTYLVLAGSKEQGWMYDEIFAAAGDSPAHRSRIVFTGYVEDADLAALYSGALAFVFPSLYEGFGLPPLEAMACGTPVVTSDVTALPEVVGEAGITVPPTDADALCGALVRVAGDEGLRRELGRRGLERAAGFSWENCAEQTVRAYRAAAGGGGRG